MAFATGQAAARAGHRAGLAAARRAACWPCRCPRATPPHVLRAGRRRGPHASATRSWRWAAPSPPPPRPPGPAPDGRRPRRADGPAGRAGPRGQVPEREPRPEPRAGAHLPRGRRDPRRRRRRGLPRRRRGRLVVEATFGLPPEAIGYRLEPGQGLAGRVAEQDRPLLTNDYQELADRPDVPAFGEVRGCAGGADALGRRAARRAGRGLSPRPPRHRRGARPARGLRRAGRGRVPQRQRPRRPGAGRAHGRPDRLPEPRRACRRRCGARSSAASAPATGSRWCWWTWTTSSRSTRSTATWWATRCCAAWATRCARPCAPTTWWPATAATSSRRRDRRRRGRGRRGGRPRAGRRARGRWRSCARRRAPRAPAPAWPSGRRARPAPALIERADRALLFGKQQGEQGAGQLGSTSCPRASAPARSRRREARRRPSRRRTPLARPRREQTERAAQAHAPARARQRAGHAAGRHDRPARRSWTPRWRSCTAPSATTCAPIVRIRDDDYVESAAGRGEPFARLGDAGLVPAARRRLIGRCLRERRPVIDGRRDRASPTTCPAGETEGVRSELVVPLWVGDELWGAINIEETRPGPSTRTTRGSCRPWPTRSARRCARPRSTSSWTAPTSAPPRRWPAALEAKDSYTAEHSRAVVERARRSGARLGLEARPAHPALRGDLPRHRQDRRARRRPHQARPADAGTSAAEIERHTIVGERILSSVDFLADVLPLVRHEHERWDGARLPRRPARRGRSRSARASSWPATPTTP